MITLSVRARRAFVVLSVALVVVLGGLFTSAAYAAPYEPNGEATLSTAAAQPGGDVTVSGGGFRSGSTVQAVIYSEPVNLGSATANAAGEVSLGVTIPASFEPGSTHTLQLQGVDSSGQVRVLSQTLTVADSEGELAYTGATVIPVIGGGLVLLTLGGMLIIRSRRKTAAL